MADTVALPLITEAGVPANSAYLADETARLRLLCRRRMLWLRKYWRRETVPGQVRWAITDQEADMLVELEDGHEEFEFYRSDEAAQEISAALAELDLQLDERRRVMDETGTLAPIDFLAARVGLTRFERQLLLLCLAQEMDPAFERICAYLQDDAARRFVTPHLALSLLAEFSSGADPSSFSSASPLRRWRLVTVETAGSSSLMTSPMRIDERMQTYLCGVNQLDPRCAALLAPAPAVPLPECHYESALGLAQWLMSVSPVPQSRWINLVGQADNGRLSMARAVCEQAGLGLLVMDLRLLPAHGADRRDQISLAEREALLLGAGLFINVETLKADEAQGLLAELSRFPVPLLLASRERIQSEHAMLPVLVSRPDASAQIELWMRILCAPEQSLPGDVEPADIQALTEQFDFGPASVARAAVLAENLAAVRCFPSPRMNAGDLWEACRQQSGQQIEQLARKVALCYDWQDMVLPHDVVQQLQEITAQVAQRHHVYQRWGFGKKLNRGRGISALFSGASGVGKTMAAEVIAMQLKLDLYRIDLAGVVSKYIGETEKNLRSVFDAAERCGAILFFDEADALFGKRSEVKDSHDRYANIEINYLLQRMEDYRGLAILATNMKGSLDAAFTRRLRFIVDFPIPDSVQRIEIWRRVFPPEAAVRDLDFGALSSLEITGGNIRNIAVNAAFLAASEGVPIGMPQVMRAARREYLKIDRLIMDAEFGRFSGVGML